MGKRPAFDGDLDKRESSSKRQRLAEPRRPPPAIHNVAQLKSLLTFQQDSGSSFKTGILSFKALLESIAYAEQSKERSEKLDILKKYCSSQRAQNNKATQPIYVPDILQSWSFASETNDESLRSTIPSVLALLLKTISSILELREFGIGVCKTLLYRDQLKLLQRGLEAPKSKDHLIAPCLRLLTEIVSFDGGAVAKTLYAHQDTTFKRLEVLLELRKNFVGDVEEDRRRPSIRTNAIRYLLANFRVQDDTVKKDMVDQRKIMNALFKHIKGDPPYIVSEILSVLEKHVVLDQDLSRFSKTQLFNEQNLYRIATLYNYEYASGSATDKATPVNELAHKFLLLVCTKPESGVLNAETGWYPPRWHAGDDDGDGKGIDLGLDAPEIRQKYAKGFPVWNKVLATFISGLRPGIDTLQSELVQETFKAAPELVASYFFEKKSPLPDPKPTTTWFGQAGFLFSTVQSSPPPFCGWKKAYSKTPPPLAVVIENILPAPVTQKILARCLNLRSEVITLFGIRLLVVAFEKLQEVLKMFNAAAAATGNNSWNEASARLTSEFCRRCPRMKDVIFALRNVPAQETQQREACLKLLSLYYELVPELALLEKFDISLPLSETLAKAGNADIQKDETINLESLKYLLSIAERSPDMKWWHATAPLTCSPFTTMLKLYVERPPGTPLVQLRSVLQSLMQENNIVQQRASQSSFESLELSLTASEDWQPTVDTFSFLDNCVLRLTRKPIKYYDLLQGVLSKSGNDSNMPFISLLLLTIEEQWQYPAKSDNKVYRRNICQWISRYLASAVQHGEDKQLIKLLRDRMIEQTQDSTCKKLLKKALKQKMGVKRTNGDHENDESDKRNESNVIGTKESIKDVDAFVFDDDDIIDADSGYPALRKWKSEDASDAIEDGHIGQLLLYLSSEHEEIRKQSLLAIKQFMQKIQNSEYADWQQVWILLAEVVETTKDTVSRQAMPNIASSFAMAALRVVADPLHILYAKVNGFLNKGPSWQLDKIAKYWLHQILLSGPEELGAHNKEIEWLLRIFVKGLRSKEDMIYYQKSKVFDHALSLYASPHLSAINRKMIVELIHRATLIDGSVALLSRSGIVAWIAMQQLRKDSNDVMLRVVSKSLYDGVEQDREQLNEWNRGNLEKTLSQLAESH